MAEFLEAVEARGRIGDPELPITLHHAGVYFFALALSAVKQDPPVDPESSIANYCIAAGAIRATVPLPEHDRAAIAGRLGLYTEFMKTLRQPRDLTTGEVETLRELGAFFRHLSRAGAAEQYATVVDTQPQAPQNVADNVVVGTLDPSSTSPEI